MLTVYTKEKCHSSKRAKQWLKEHRIHYKEKKLNRYRLTKIEFIQILSLTENGTDDILSHHSIMYKQLELEIGNLLLSELRVLIGENPTLLRSPIILNEKILLIGFNSDEMGTLITKKERKTRQRDHLFESAYAHTIGFRE